MLKMLTYIAVLILFIFQTFESQDYFIGLSSKCACFDCIFFFLAGGGHSTSDKEVIKDKYLAL